MASSAEKETTKETTKDLVEENVLDLTIEYLLKGQYILMVDSQQNGGLYVMKILIKCILSEKMETKYHYGVIWILLRNSHVSGNMMNRSRQLSGQRRCY